MRTNQGSTVLFLAPEYLVSWPKFLWILSRYQNSFHYGSLMLNSNEIIGSKFPSVQWVSFSPFLFFPFGRWFGIFVTTSTHDSRKSKKIFKKSKGLIRLPKIHKDAASDCKLLRIGEWRTGAVEAIYSLSIPIYIIPLAFFCYYPLRFYLPFFG